MPVVGKAAEIDGAVPPSSPLWISSREWSSGLDSLMECESLGFCLVHVEGPGYVQAAAKEFVEGLERA